MRSNRPLPGQPGPHGPIVLAPPSPRRRDAHFGAPLPDSPLPGRLLVALSRLHRAEDAPAKATENG
ncbi:hypothetical protein [Methylobacterium sp. J-076]|uniref:hypothetical protein n=1 Tax=Methylobacterium sp. J-076 TaxID=2836655 RepID=UPI001FBA3BCB|nr:hypothetical protein [Methylobacterium sp. J-076]